MTTLVRLVVPSPDGRRVLGRPNGLAGWELPRLTIGWSAAFEAVDTAAAGRLLGGPVAPVRRIDDGTWELVPRGRLAVSASQWIGLDEVGRLGVDASVVTRWSSLPPGEGIASAAWAADAEAWVDTFARRTGVGTSIRHWELSAVARVPTDDGDLVVKENCPGFDREGDVLEALSGIAGVPPLIVTDGARFAVPWIEGRVGDLDDPADAALVLASLGRIHRAAVDRAHLLPPLPRPAELDDVTAAAFAAVDALDLPDTVAHVDAHAGNLLVPEHGPPVLIDWTDAHAASPLLDLRVALRPREEPGALDPWCDAWADIVDPVLVKAALPAILLAGSATTLDLYRRARPTLPASLHPSWDEFTEFWERRLAADLTRVGSTGP